MNNRFIDVHHHIIPDVYREGLKDVGITHSGGKAIGKWSVEDSLELMDSLGIESAICSISEPAVYPVLDIDRDKAISLARKTNEYMAQMCRDYPDRFGAFAILPMPDVEASLKELEYALDVLKLDGIGLLSNYHGAYLGNREFNELFTELQRRKACAYVHPSVPPVDLPRPEFVPIDYFEEFTFNTTRAATNLILSGTMENCPDVKLIFSHMGGVFPYLRWRLNSCHRGAINAPVKNLPMDPYVYEGWEKLTKPFQDYMSLYYYDTALSTHDIAFEAVKITAPGHILYGSDSFYASRANCERFGKCINEYYTDPDELYAVSRGTAETLFPRFKK